MTPTPTARVTPERWEAGFGEGITGPTACEWHYMPGWDGVRYEIVTKPGGAGQGLASVVCVLPRAEGDTDRNQVLIVAAVNACFAINKDDPLAAAQHLEELVRTCGELTSAFGYLVGSPDGSWERFKSALSRVLGKSA